ncbi:NAD(+) synthase [Acetobacteraceae bacterium]|nr:NAD(+) synthase [Acetobacteraceae bacterium]
MPKDCFHSIYHQGFCRVAAAHHPIRLGAPKENAKLVANIMRQCDKKQVAVTVFPELSLTGYSLEDLFFQRPILDEALEALKILVHASKDWYSVGVVGLPICHNQTLYNCAAIFHKGILLGLVPKTHILSEGEFYEARHFASGQNVQQQQISLWGKTYPFGTDLLFQAKDFPDLCFGVEICQDLWVPNSPGIAQIEAGALIIANLSASPGLIGRKKDRHLLCASYAKRLMTGYIYAASGWGESTNDLVWDGQMMIYEAGEMLGDIASSLPDSPELLIRDIDLQALRAKRLRSNYFRQLPPRKTKDKFTFIAFHLSPISEDIGFERNISPFPFHFQKESMAENTLEVLEYQAVGLAKRLQASKASKMVIGVSGGLDSALALLVCHRSAEILNWSFDKIIACSLTGYGTSKTSEDLGAQLMKSLQVEIKNIDIRPICQKIFQSLDHPAKDFPLQGNISPNEMRNSLDLTFENVQAGIRTDLLFRLAGQQNALVIGTGDLSELALGWCTYGVGDQMAHYNVNAGIPKTLIQQIVCYFSNKDALKTYPSALREILAKIAERPISPELLPSDNPNTLQSTESAIGPYALQDFILWHVLKYGAGPKRIAFLLQKAWGKHSTENSHSYEAKELLKWLEIFGKRFFNFSQFKRSAMPNGPKILPDIGLSPRGDWRAPSDLEERIWTSEIESIKKMFCAF